MSYQPESNPHFLLEERHPLHQGQLTHPHGTLVETGHPETSPHFYSDEQPLHRGQPSRPRGFNPETKPHWPPQGRTPRRHRPHAQTPLEQPRRDHPSGSHGKHLQAPHPHIQTAMPYQPETNPHFFSEEQPLSQDIPDHPHGTHVESGHPETNPHFHLQEQPLHQRQLSHPHGFNVEMPQQQPPPDQTPRRHHLQAPLEQLEHSGQPLQQPAAEHSRHPEQRSHVRAPHMPLPAKAREQYPGRSPGRPRRQQVPTPVGLSPPVADPHLPPQRPTKPLAWFGAIFCAVFGVAVFLAGLIILIVYIMFRPQSPQFDISGATLNAAYLDVGNLLNADLSLLANFTNLNKKVSVDFSYIVVNLYYEDTLIATESVYPFTAERMQSIFANVHMVSSQVPLPLGQSQRLAQQRERNGVVLTVKGFFRVRSKLGGLLHYSYWLYGKCTLLLTSPPSGVLRDKRCKTKR